MSILIAGVIFGGILTGYIQPGKRAEWSVFLCGTGLRHSTVGEARAAVWDISAATNVNEITNLNLIGWPSRVASGRVIRTNIDIPYSGTNFIRATNFVSVSNVTIS